MPTSLLSTPSSGVFLSIVLTGFAVAFFHAAIPTHWLPFVMAARTQGWSRARTLAITGVAGLGHVLITTILGVLIVWLGISFDEELGHYFPMIAGSFLVLFGLYYIFQFSRGHGHVHFGHHNHHCAAGHAHAHGHGRTHGHDHDQTRSSKLFGSKTTVSEATKFTVAHEQKVPVRTSDRVAILSLIAMLTFSPCEGFLPVYVSAISYGWTAFVILSLILAIATLLGMVIFTWLTLVGLQKFKLVFLEKYESLLMGLILCCLGIAVAFFEHGHAHAH